MNAFVIAFVLISLVGSEWLGANPVDDWLERTLGVLVVVSLVPALAIFQTEVVRNRVHERKLSNQVLVATIRRMSVAHAVVWLTASAALIWALRWQDVVRGNWGLGYWLLLDEFVIMVPAVLALQASWLVFYQLHQPLFTSAVEPSLKPAFGESSSVASSSFLNLSRVQYWIRPRWQFVAIRFRMHFLVGWVPLTIILLMLDLNRLGYSEIQLQTFALGGAILLGLLWPWVMQLVWDVKPIADPELQDRLSQAVSDQQVSTLRFRRWETGGQIPNAAVVGLIPYFRTVFVSDVILDQFRESEMMSLVRHEVAHIQRHHGWWKLGSLLLPVLTLGCHQSWLERIGKWSLEIEGLPAIELAPVTMIFSAGVLIVAWWNNRWLFHQLELEADLCSVDKQRCRLIGTQPDRADGSPSCGVCPNNVNDLRQALCRLAAYSGEDWKRATLFHPSLHDRLEFLNWIESNPQKAARFQIAFAAKRSWMLIGWLTVAACGAMATFV